MGAGLPIFPLGAVLFPGVTMPLHIFEERYRSLVSTLISDVAEPERAFGIVAIREGFEVGSRGVHSLQRVGCEARLLSVDQLDDGRFDIEVVGGRRLRVDAVDPSGEYIVGQVEWLAEAAGDDAERAANRARAMFERYRVDLAQMRGNEVLAGDLPHDPTGLSYSLAATCLLTLQQRQNLLEVDDDASRLRMLTGAMRQEMQAMRAIPSLPATEVARTGWSPN
ncbi:MAG TPA: LON peptidase substrate-binding domain-containing protein [Nocardioidaceae bacterium]|nr:LON peptidase substrate-binding domain-containing protein [Nocardioidaceae bacterium]